MVTRQIKLDSYIDAGLATAVDLVNTFAVARAGGRDAHEVDDAIAELGRIFAIDPPSVARLRRAHVPRFRALANELHGIFAALAALRVDQAAAHVNRLLAAYPAHPHLAKEAGTWRMHHHPANVALVSMWTAIWAENIARMIGAGLASRFRACEARDCDRVFFDTSRNATRRYCRITCQGRAKTAAFRLRRGPRR
jgi:predicted RNA-binding Zn ribbon-like protein